MRKAMLLIAIFGLVGALRAADPIIGTWDLNLTKSKVATQRSTPKELTEVYRETEGNQIEFISKATLADGSSYLMKGVWPAPGGTGEVLQGGDPAVSYVQTLIEPGNWYRTALHDGKQVALIHKTFSKDGRVMIQTHKGMDRQGRPFEDVLVYDRQ